MPRVRSAPRPSPGRSTPRSPAISPKFTPSTWAAPRCPVVRARGSSICSISVPDGEMENVKELLDRLGFQRQTGPEPFPEDRPMRVGSLTHEGETFLLHVHVIPAASPEVEEMRFLRACLRADSELMKAYVAQKRKIIAGGVTDSLEYCKAKGEFLKMVLGS